VKSSTPERRSPPASVPAPLPSPTLQDECYQRLRQRLTVGRFLPSERLKIRHVANDPGMGLMPVRAALQRLAAEGALINVPNAGVIVPLLSPPEFDDVLDMRLLLEGTAAERGCLRLDAADVQAMQVLGARMAQALDAADATMQQCAVASNATCSWLESSCASAAGSATGARGNAAALRHPTPRRSVCRTHLERIRDDPKALDSPSGNSAERYGDTP